VASVATTTTPYLNISYKADWAGGKRLNLNINGVGVGYLAAKTMPNGWVVAQYPTNGVTITSLAIAVEGWNVFRNFDVAAFLASTLVARIDDVTLTNQPISTGTGATVGHQQQRLIEIAGSARAADMTLRVSSPDSNPLSDVMVYTNDDWEDAYTPTLSGFYTSGASGTPGTPPPSSRVGSVTNSGGTPVFEIPADSLRAGSYTVIGRAYRFTSGIATVTISARLYVNGSAVGDPSTTSGQVRPGMTDWEFTRFGALSLPPLDTYGGAGVTVRITFTLGTGTYLDDAWILRQDGSISIIEAGSAKHLFMEAPSLDFDRGRILTGLTADRVGAYSPGAGVIQYDWPELSPPRANVFVVATGCQNAEATLTYHRSRW
jgi:hypothetical protein